MHLTLFKHPIVWHGGLYSTDMFTDQLLHIFDWVHTHVVLYRNCKILHLTHSGSPHVHIMCV